MTAYRNGVATLPAHIDRAARADHDAGATRKGILGIALQYGSGVRGEDAYFEDIPDLQLPQDLAHVIIERKAGNFQPQEFTDRYEDAVVELIRAKQARIPAKVTEQRS